MLIYQPSGRAREYAPWAANLYSGCAHGCLYCYAPMVLRRDRAEFRTAPSPRANVLEQLAREAKKLPSGIKVLLSFTTDPYQPCEEEYGITRRAIEILHAHGLGVEILTKGGRRAARDFDLLGEEDAFGSTLTFLSPQKSREWEPNAALPEDRLAAIEEAHGRGITVWVSLEPVIEPEETLKIVKATHGMVDLYKVGPLTHHPLSETVNWRAFGLQVQSLFRELGSRYYLKEDLRRFLREAKDGSRAAETARRSV